MESDILVYLGFDPDLFVEASQLALDLYARGEVAEADTVEGLLSCLAAAGEAIHELHGEVLDLRDIPR